MANKNYEPVRNYPLYLAMQEARRSSVASPHDSRPGRTKTRRDGKRQAMKDWN